MIGEFKHPIKADLSGLSVSPSLAQESSESAYPRHEKMTFQADFDRQEDHRLEALSHLEYSPKKFFSMGCQYARP